jgi:elongation factor Ts
MVTAEQVKALRDATGVSVGDCKRALEEAGGDMDKAMSLLREKSKGMSAKKADRELKAGAIQSYIHATGTVGVLVELSCETDFVAKNEEFKAMARDIAVHIAAMNPETVKKERDDQVSELVLLEQPFVKNPEVTVAGLIEQGIQKFGEKIEVTRFARFAVSA